MNISLYVNILRRGLNKYDDDPLLVLKKTREVYKDLNDIDILKLLFGFFDCSNLACASVQPGLVVVCEFDTFWHEKAKLTDVTGKIMELLLVILCKLVIFGFNKIKLLLTNKFIVFANLTYIFSIYKHIKYLYKFKGYLYICYTNKKELSECFFFVNSRAYDKSIFVCIFMLILPAVYLGIYTIYTSSIYFLFYMFSVVTLSFITKYYLNLYIKYPTIYILISVVCYAVIAFSLHYFILLYLDILEKYIVKIIDSIRDRFNLGPKPDNNMPPSNSPGGPGGSEGTIAVVNTNNATKRDITTEEIENERYVAIKNRAYIIDHAATVNGRQDKNIIELSQQRERAQSTSDNAAIAEIDQKIQQCEKVKMDSHNRAERISSVIDERLQDPDEIRRTFALGSVHGSLMKDERVKRRIDEAKFEREIAELTAQLPGLTGKERKNVTRKISHRVKAANQAREDIKEWDNELIKLHNTMKTWKHWQKKD